MKYIAQSRARTLVGAEMPALTGFGRIGRYDVPLSARNQANFVMLAHMGDEQSYRKKMETQLNEIGSQISELLDKVGTAADKELEALRPKLKAAGEKLDELKHTSTEAWGDLKPGLEKAWAELQKSLNQAAARFKTPRSK